MYIRKLVLVSAVASAAMLSNPLAARALEKVTVAASFVGLWDTSQPTFCKERGEFEKAGLDVKIVSTRGGSETVQAVTAGGMDIAYSPGIYAVLAAYEHGAPIKIISSEFVGANDIFMYVLPDSPIHSINDLNGKTVAFPRPGGSTQIMLLALKAETGLKFKLVATGSEDATRTMVMTKQVDVGYYLPPDGVDVVMSGKVRLLFSGGVVKSLKNISGRVNIASAEFIKNRRAVAIKFMRVLNDCIDWMYSHPEQAAKMFATLNSIDEQVARRTMEFYPRDTLALVPLRGLQAVTKQAIDNGFIDRVLTAKQLKELIDIVYTPGN